MTVKQDISRVRMSGGTFLIIYAMLDNVSADSGNVDGCKRKDGEGATTGSSKHDQRVEDWTRSEGLILLLLLVFR